MTATQAMIEAVWSAARASGLTSRCEINGQPFDAIYLREDEAVLDNLALSAGHRLVVPAGDLVVLPGDTVLVNDSWFVVRRVDSTRDGAEFVLHLSETA